MTYLKNLILLLTVASICLSTAAWAQEQKKIKTLTSRTESISFKPFRTDTVDEVAWHHVLDERINVDSLPPSVPIRPYSVAIVIGVEKYKSLPKAPFASRDALLMERYFKTVLGVDKVITYTDTTVSGFFFENQFDAGEGEIARLITRDKTDLFVYYSGHGMHSSSGDERYLLPFDAKTNSIDRQGFSLNNLLDQLSALPTKSTTVVIDACFSGLGKFATERPVNLIPMKGIVVRPLVSQPWKDNPSFRLITSSSNEQPSLVLGESRTGLFTYFFAAGLQGNADLNNDGRITMAELRQYINTHVPEISRKIYQEQTPCFYGDDAWVVAERK